MTAAGNDALILLLVGGGLVLGLPHVTARDRARFWHPWVNSGLLPLLLGLCLGPSFGGWLSLATAQALQPFLALALTAAGVLLGTQLRPAYLVGAGRVFLLRETRGAVGTFAAVALPTAACVLPALGSWSTVGIAGLVGACAVVTTQRPPRAAWSATPRAVLIGHVVPAGWWNLVGLGLGALALGIGDRPEQGWSGLLLVLAIPAWLGLLLGRAAAGARSAAEAFLFLPAVLALAGGLALALGSTPLLTGMAVGCLLANAGTGRAALVERAIDEMEQPITLATGLLAGLCLAPVAAHPAAWLIALVVPLRWLLRGWWAPTVAALARPRDQRVMPLGAAGVMLIASAGLAPAPLPTLVLPLTVALALGTLLADLAERRP